MATAALNRPILIMLLATAAVAAAGQAYGNKNDTCNCPCSIGDSGKQVIGIVLYLAAFACVFIAGSFTNPQRLFHGRKKVNTCKTPDSSVTLNGTSVVDRSQWNHGLSMMEQLVPEITLHVLTYLDFKSLCCMSMTNLAMKKVANDESAWKSLYHKDFNSEQSNIVHPNGWKSHYAVTKAVSEANRSFYNKFRSKSLRGMGRIWLQADYVKSVHPGLELVSGYDAVMENWSLVFKWSQSMDLQLRDSKVRVMGDVAWVTNKATVNTATEPLVITNCYEFHNGKWYVVHHHCSPQIDFAYPDYNMLA